MRLLRLIVWKEFQHLLGDKAALRLLFILPMVQLIVLGYALTTEVKNTPYAVIDRCQRNGITRFSLRTKPLR